MRYKFYKNNEDAWMAMFDAIKNSKTSIYWESYILKNDTSPYLNFFGIIKEKAKEGVKIRIVLDGFATLWFENIENSLLIELRMLGVEVLFFNSWFHRIHRKILIIDEEKAFLGGVNVAHSYRSWLDLHILIEGKKIVKTLLSSFARSYFYSGGKNPYLLSLRQNSQFRKTELWLLDHFPNVGRLLLKRYYVEKIALAEKKIIMVTPFFTPKPWLVKALKQALLRGVDVQIILPQKTESIITDFSNHIFTSALYDLGMKVYMTKEMIHAKALLVDDKVGLVGSNNLDTQSFDFNIEASLSFERKDMIKDLGLILEDWKKDSVPFDDNKYSSGWYYRPLELIVGKLAEIFF
ncbi:MAG: phosphatidylserine/phosphatidylglycerophosphate/cardiolipin synthase family protein [bacterium]